MIIDGKLVAEKILERAALEVEELKKIGVTPGLAVVVAGKDPASRIYVNNKKKACERVGIRSTEYALDESVSQEELLRLIESLNSDPETHGILVQLPLPGELRADLVARAVSPEKDVDCFNPYNVGETALGTASIYPCTPSGIIELLKYAKVKIEGKSCVVIGRSNIVGKPLSLMLLKENATVTTCHGKTRDLKSVCLSADIVVSATGKAGLVTSDMIRAGATVIDVGISRAPDGKIRGDVDFKAVSEKAENITPVPGGVGPTTIACLIKNTVILTRNAANRRA